MVKLAGQGRRDTGMAAAWEFSRVERLTARWKMEGGKLRERPGCERTCRLRSLELGAYFHSVIFSTPSTSPHPGPGGGTERDAACSPEALLALRQVIPISPSLPGRYNFLLLILRLFLSFSLPTLYVELTFSSAMHLLYHCFPARLAAQGSTEHCA